MKLLLDQNLSRRLIGILAAEYPGTEHVLLLGMAKIASKFFVRTLESGLRADSAGFLNHSSSVKQTIFFTGLFSNEITQ